MTPERARAYQRVMTTVDGLAAAKLHPDEQAIVRAAADALFFLPEGEDATSAVRDDVAALTHLVERLMVADRLTATTLDRLVVDVSACGPPQVSVAA